MKIFNKIGIISFSLMSLLLLNFGFCGLKIGPIGYTFSGNSTPKVNNDEIININSGGKTFSDKLGGILHIPQKDDYSTSLGYVISLVQITINWLLGLLASVVLIYMLYCGFLVLSAGSDDKNVSKGKKGISNATITIVGIGLSWLVISAIIRFINMISKDSS